MLRRRYIQEIYLEGIRVMKLDIKYKYIEYAISIIAILLMFAIPCMHYYLLRVGGYNDTLAYTIYWIVGVLLIILLIGVFFNKNVEFEFGKYEYILIALITLATLSTLSSLDKNSSLWGWNGRNEGLLMLLTYYTLLYTCRFIKKSCLKKKVILGFLLVGIMHSIYGLFQISGILRDFVFDNYSGYFISGVAGNPNFMATFLVLQCGVTAGLFYYSDKFWKHCLYLILLLFFLITLILTKTMSGLFGVSVMVLFFFIYLFITKGKHLQFKNKYLNSFSLLCCALVIGIIGIFVINSLMNNYLFDEFIKMFSQLNQMIGTGEITEEMGSGRFAVWANAMKLFPKYWLYGCGVDTFGIAYTQVFGLSSEGLFFDKAHNEYLQIALTMGIPALCLYLTLYGNVIVDSIKRLDSILTTEGRENEEGMYVGIGLAIIGYIAQAFFNISVIDVAPYFWILLGLVADNSNIKVKVKRKLDKPKVVLVNRVAHVITEEEVFE